MTTKRILTNQTGAFKKVFAVKNYNLDDDQQRAHDHHVYPWWKPLYKYYSVYESGGSKTWDWGATYQVTKNTSKGGFYGIRYDDWTNLFNASSADYQSFSNNNSSIYNQRGGYNFGFKNHFNTSDKSHSNGFAYALTTDKQNYFNGASPMPVQGICFRLFADGNGTWKGKQNGLNSGDDYTGEGSIEASVDIQIGNMHLIYLTADTQEMYCRAILPEGGNTGDVKFYNGWFDKNRGIEKKIYNSKANNNKNALLVRAWNEEPLKPKSCFIGFSFNVYVGSVSSVNKTKSFSIGSMSPILTGDLENMMEASPNRSTSQVCWEPRTTSQSDAKSRFDIEKNGKRLLIFTDNNHSNQGKESERSISTAAGTGVLKY